jgi:hypothetical protein
MMKKLLESAKWLYEQMILTTMWTLIFSLIIEDEDAFFPFMVIDCENIYGACIAMLITCTVTESMRIIAKRVRNTIKEIKG